MSGGLPNGHERQIAAVFATLFSNSFLSALEALTFGLGVAFLVYGWPLVGKVESSARRNGRALYLATAWLLVSWWPHDNMHIHNGLDLQGLLYIEYEFHFTLLTASFAIAYHFFHFIKHYHPQAAKA